MKKEVTWRQCPRIRASCHSEVLCTFILNYFLDINLKLKPLGGALGGSKELRFFMSQHRKSSARGKVIDKKWFIRIARLWGLQASRWVLLCPKYLAGYVFTITGKVGRGKDHLLPHSWVDIALASAAPPPGRAGEFSCPYTVKPRLSWHYGKIISGLSTMRAFHFEMSPFHKLLFFMCAKGMS